MFVISSFGDTVQVEPVCHAERMQCPYFLKGAASIFFWISPVVEPVIIGNKICTLTVNGSEVLLKEPFRDFRIDSKCKMYKCCCFRIA